MKLWTVLVVLVGLAWAGLWITNTGVLIYSSDTGVLKTRDCRYLIGVTVVKSLEPLAQRCQVLKSVGR